jgi:hypothetical protein
LRRRYHSQVLVTQDHISTRMRRNFENYHALGSALSHRRRMIQIRCSQHNNYQPYDDWTIFFWQKWSDLIREVVLYRNQLDTADTSRISRYHMQNALFEFLVFLFLSAEQIEKLKEVVSNDVDVQIALDDMCEANKHNEQGNRELLLREIKAEFDLNDDSNPKVLQTAVYMVQVDDVSVWRAEEFPDNWRRIHYGDCLALLKFAKAQTDGVTGRMHAIEEQWRALLGTFEDKDGNALRPCSLCHDNIRDVIYKPCNHFMACLACAEEWKRQSATCPFCRRQITSIETVLLNFKGHKKIPFTQNASLAPDGIVSLLTELKQVAQEPWGCV